MEQGATVTTGSLLLSLSSLASGTAETLLQNITSGGGVTWIPAQTITADMSQMTLSADFINQSISADLVILSVDANILQPIYNADILQNILEGDL
jgi:hypothetical protein